MDIARATTRLSLRASAATVRRFLAKTRQWPQLLLPALVQRASLLLTSRHGSPLRWLPPWGINLVPTLRCDQHCDYCSNRATLRPCRNGELPPEWLRPRAPPVWRALINRLGLWKPMINIGGGEPTMFPDLPELLGALRRRGLYVSFTTNGSGLAAIAEDVVRCEVPLVGISYDGPPAIHDRVAGRPGSYQRAEDALLHLAEARDRLGASTRIKAIFTISSRNQGHIAGTVRRLLALPVDSISVRHFMRTPCLPAEQRPGVLAGVRCGVSFPFGGEDARLQRPFDARSVIEQLAEVARLSAESSIPVVVEPAFDDHQIEQFYDPQDTELARGRACPVPWHVLEIYPDGQAVFCGQHFFLPLGDLSRRRLLQIWNGPRMRSLRATLRQTPSFEVCRRCCGLLLSPRRNPTPPANAA